MKKRFLYLSTIITTFIMVLGLSIMVSAETEGLVFTQDPEGTAYSLTGYSGDATEVVIPATYEGLPVTSIGESAFKDCEEITSVSIPSSVTIIKNYAFRSCDKLASVTFDENSQLVEIGAYAFFGCRSLPGIELPSSLTTIGLSTFDSCDKLESITIPASVTYIGEYAFSWCIGLNEIIVEPGNSVYHSDGNCLIRTADKTLIAGTNTSVIPDNGSVEIISRDSFSCRGSLAEIVIPEGVTKIAKRAFIECTSLKMVSIPSTVTTIGDAAFSYCGSLESITVADGNTKYHSQYHSQAHEEGDCPEGCLKESYCLIETSTNTLIAGCKQSVIPNYIVSIGANAFYGCWGLDTITIPASVTSIGEQAFAHTALNSIYVDEGNQYYHGDGSCLIETATGILIVGSQNLSIPNDVTSIAAYAFYNCDQITEIVIPSSVVSIGDYAFYACDGLQSVSIPSGVTSIGTAAFSCCNGLESITVEEGNTKYRAIGNCLVEIETGILISGCKTSVIPNDGSVTSIGANAFYSCLGLQNLIIPEGVTTIGREAFYNCDGIVTVKIPASVTNIAYRAFYDCTEMKTVYYEGFEAGWNSISKDTFWDEGSNYTMILLENSDIFFDDSDKDISINAECVPYETEKIIAVNISWTVPVFSYTVEYEWSAESLTEQVKDGSQRWSTDFATITVENRSNQNIGAEFAFATKIADSGIVGKFTSDENGDTLLTDSAVTLDSAEKNKVETVSTVYFFVTDGVLPENHVSGESIGNITITISAKGN